MIVFKQQILQFTSICASCSCGYIFGTAGVLRKLHQLALKRENNVRHKPLFNTNEMLALNVHRSFSQYLTRDG